MSENLNALCIGELSSIIYRQYQSYMNHELKACGINFSECAYLIKIPDNEAVTQSYVAEKLFCDNAVMTRTLLTLKKKGLVNRNPSPFDKRAVMVSLTAKGVAAKNLGIELRKKWKKISMSDMSPDKVEMIMKLFRNIAKKALNANNL